FERWLNEKIWVAESALTEEDVYWGAALAACEMIRAGIVGFADHYFWMDQVARAVEESGLRALLAWCYFGIGREHEVGHIDLETALRFATSWNNAAGGRIRTALGPHSPYMCPPEALRAVADAAQRLGVPVHLHLAESDEQVRVSRHKHGLSPVAHVAAQGIFDGPAIAAHCISVDDDDVAILAHASVTVAHTPKTYLKLAMGMTPLARLQAAGVRIALGTDGPASNNDLDLLQVMRLTGLLQKAAASDAAAMPVDRLLRLATVDGARALGFEASGAIAPGAAADLLLVDTGGPHWWPQHDPLAGLVYGAHPGDVRDVLVDGRWLMRDRRLLTIDEERVKHEAQRRALRMVGAPMSQVRAYAG
ncbi:MAG: amidohydrolase, partial [Deltaproteobacteria bacterium]|nr:amidohydrolase [Deltaproteobacteria bacterium]